MNNLKKIFNDAPEVSFKKKEVIIKAGDYIKNISYVKKGFIIAYDGKSKDRKVILIISSGDIFPLTPEIRHEKIAVQLEAGTDVAILSVNKSKFFKKVYSDKKYLKGLVKQLADYLMLYVERINNLELPTTQKKVVARILNFKDRFGKEKDKKIFIDIPTTHELISQSINVARENVSREISKLQKEKLIDYKNGYITILDLKGLEKKLQE